MDYNARLHISTLDIHQIPAIPAIHTFQHPNIQKTDI